jgi:hypothetical protein
MNLAALTDSIERDGFFLVRGVSSSGSCDRALADFSEACEKNALGLIRSENGTIIGARNLLDMWPGVLQIAFQPALIEAVRKVLGSEFGLVRILYFDKPPGESWALPWHKDLAIAVKDNRIRSDHFRRPTTKHGVPHVEAPGWLLKKMLTARLHLDEVTEENGPLRVIPGSHQGETSSETEARILCSRGEVLFMRPLLSHSSGHSLTETTKHRRILHFEFSPVRELPDGYEWQSFVTPDRDNHGFHGSHG